MLSRFLLALLGALVIGAGSAQAVPIPAGPSLVEVPSGGVTSVALEGAPDELSIAATQCTARGCRISLAMDRTSGRDLRAVDPAQVGTLVTSGPGGSARITLTAAPSLRAEIASAQAAQASLQRLLGVALIIVMSIISLLLIELAPGALRRPLRVTVLSWVVGLLPVACATGVVILAGAGSRGFLVAAGVTALCIPLLRMLVAESAALGRMHPAQ